LASSLGRELSLAMRIVACWPIWRANGVAVHAVGVGALQRSREQLVGVLEEEGGACAVIARRSRPALTAVTLHSMFWHVLRTIRRWRAMVAELRGEVKEASPRSRLVYELRRRARRARVAGALREQLAGSDAMSR